MQIMRIQKDQNGRVSVDFSVGECYGVVKKDPRLFVDVVNAIADGADRITFPSEECFGDVKGGINNSKPPVDPVKKVEENRDDLLKEIESIISPITDKEEKKKAMMKGEKILDNLATLGLYAIENNLNISNEDDLNTLRKKIAEIMEEE